MLSSLVQRLADVERWLMIEEAADRAADLDRIARLRAHAIDLRLQIAALNEAASHGSAYLDLPLRSEAEVRAQREGKRCA